MVGFVDVQRASYPKYPMIRMHDFAMIENAVVDKLHRGKGIGTMLLRATIEWAKDRGLLHIQTTVWHENVKAREFYLDQGFRPTTVRLELDIKGDAEQTNSAEDESAG